MSSLNQETIGHLARLSRINCSEEERKGLLKNLTDILAYFEQLQEVDTEEVPPCNHVLADMVSEGREDLIEKERLLDQETFLQNSPAHLGGLIQVPPVMES